MVFNPARVDYDPDKVRHDPARVDYVPDKVHHDPAWGDYVPDKVDAVSEKVDDDPEG